MKKFLILMGLSCTLFFTSCSTVNVSSDYDRAVDFTQYKTYAFHQKGIDKMPVSDLDKKRIVSEIENQMALKGFVKSESNPDLFVNVLTSSKEQIDINNNYYGGWYNWGPYWGGPASYVNQYTSGTIIIDIIDNQKNILVWQGAGSGLNVSDLDNKAEQLPKAVDEILAKFPPGYKKK